MSWWRLLAGFWNFVTMCFCSWCAFYMPGDGIYRLYMTLLACLNAYCVKRSLFPPG